MSGAGHHGGMVTGSSPAQPHQLPPALRRARPRRRGGVGFTVVLSIVMVLGAGAMALVLLASGAPNALVIGVVLAALPVGPLIACFMWLDRYEPEPLNLLGFAFGWGAFVATTVALVLQILAQATLGLSDAWAAATVAPATEEATKGVFVVLLLFMRRHEVDGILDGIVYAGVVAIGFAFTENILYLASAYMGGEGLGAGGLGAATGTFVIRGIFSPFAHPFFTAAIGVGVGYAVITRSGLMRFLAPLLGYGVAVLAHALWNASAFFGGGQLFVLTYLFAMVPAFLLTVGFAVWVRKREGEMLSRALTDCAYRGFLPHQEVPWLVRLPGRRASRRFAKDNGGPGAANLVSDYQQQAIELGFLHGRFLRGTAPADFAHYGQEMVDYLAALRPYVMFPPTPVRTWPPDTNRGGAG
ncbi:MAG TPA: PrsW family intramembrane metalloprotease [Nocardioidaceae bacterium]|nr:PrsW family intramembrane metalloprotease [Nocardioidaceae bacterium]